MESFDQKAGEVVAVEGRGQGELRIVELNGGKLYDSVGDLFVPVAAAAFNHSDRETVKRDIENVLVLSPPKPGGQPAQLVVPFDEKDLLSVPRQNVGRGHSRQAAADNDDIIGVGVSCVGSAHIRFPFI